MDEIVDAMQADKKRTADGMKLVLLRKIGDSFIDPVDLPTCEPCSEVGHASKDHAVPAGRHCAAAAF